MLQPLSFRNFIAFALTFQADRTLTVEEVAVEYDKIFAVLAEKFDAAMRA